MKALTSISRLTPTKTIFNRNFATSVCLMSEDQVRVTVAKNGIRSIVLNRPEAKNALSHSMLVKIGAAVREGNTDDNTKILTITGVGDFFTAGNDLNNWRGASLEEIKETTRKYGLEHFLFPFMECRKPVVALVNGGVVGGGATLLPHCDLILASEKAFILTPFTSLGIVPEFGSSLNFPNIMGFPKASDILLFGHKMTAQEALQSGFISKLFPDNVFVAECDKLLDVYSKLPLEPMIKSKELIRGPQCAHLKRVIAREYDYILQLVGGPTMNERLKNFFSK